ncbi:LptF/LptG family permease [Candidatus Riflebacteria bacterium]
MFIFSRWTLLDSYILRQLFKPFFMGFFGFVLILSVEPINTAVRNVVNQNHDPNVVFLWLLARIPQDLGLAFPMATLLASLSVFGDMSKHSELIAFLAGGVDFWRIQRPVFIFACFCTVITLLFNEYAIPQAAIKRRYYRKKVMQKNIKWRDKKRVFQKTRENKLVYIREVLPNTNKLLNLNLYTFNSSHRMVERLTAKVASQEEKGSSNIWLLKDVMQTFYDKNRDIKQTRFFPSMKYKMEETTDVFARDIKKTSEMSMRRLWEWISYYDRSGSVNTLPMKTEFFSKTSLPFTCFIFAIIGACLGVGKVRASGFVGFGVAILVIFFYYFILTTSLSLGKTGTLPPFLAAWLPNLLFLGLSFYLSQDAQMLRA